MNHTRPPLAVAVAIALLTTACGSDDDPAIATSPAPTPPATVADDPSPSPSPEPSPSPTSTQPAVDVVDVVDFAFEPSELSLGVGSTVTWTHVGDVNHTVTFSSGGPDSGNLTPGDTFEVTFDEPGRFSYRCIYHGQMTGVVTIS